MKPWNHLPNAVYIDQILSSVHTSVEAWDRELTQWQYDFNYSAQAMRRLREFALASIDSKIDDSMRQLLDDSFSVIVESYEIDKAQYVKNMETSGFVDQLVSVNLGYEMAWHAIRILIADTDAGKFMTMSLDRLKVLSALGENPVVAVILPVAYVLESDKVLTQTDGE